MDGHTAVDNNKSVIFSEGFVQHDATATLIYGCYPLSEIYAQIKLPLEKNDVQLKHTYVFSKSSSESGKQRRIKRRFLPHRALPSVPIRCSG